MTIFRQSRPKLTAMTALFAAWSAVVGFMGFVSAHAEGLWPYLALSLFAPLALAGAVAAIAAGLSWWRPATLIADDSGVVFKTWRSEQRFAWDDIEGFVVLTPEARLRSPGVQLQSGPRRFVSFGRNWQQTAEEIVAGLEEANGPRALPE